MDLTTKDPLDCLSIGDSDSLPDLSEITAIGLEIGNTNESEPEISDMKESEPENTNPKLRMSNTNNPESEVGNTNSLELEIINVNVKEPNTSKIRSSKYIRTYVRI